MNASARNEEGNAFLCYDCYPDVKRLERQYQSLQASYFDLRVEMSRLELYARQILKADPIDRDQLINELKSTIFIDVDTISQLYDDCLPTLEQHDIEMGDIKMKQHCLMEMLRKQVGSLEKASVGIPTEERTAESSADCESHSKDKPYPEGEKNTANKSQVFKTTLTIKLNADS